MHKIREHIIRGRAAALVRREGTKQIDFSPWLEITALSQPLKEWCCSLWSGLYSYIHILRNVYYWTFDTGSPRMANYQTWFVTTMALKNGDEQQRILKLSSIYSSVLQCLRSLCDSTDWSTPLILKATHALKFLTPAWRFYTHVTREIHVRVELFPCSLVKTTRRIDWPILFLCSYCHRQIKCNLLHTTFACCCPRVFLWVLRFFPHQDQQL